MQTDRFAELFGSLIGGLICIYLIGKIFEWLFFKRFIKNSNHVIAASSIAGFLVVFLLWATSPTVFFGFSMASFFIAAILLPIIRIQWQKRNAKREIALHPEVDQKDLNNSSQNSHVVTAEASEKKSQLSKFNISTNIDGPDDDAFYTIVAEELESGKTDKGLWTRLFAESEGDEKQVKALYITRRVEKMMEAEKSKKQLLQKQEPASPEQKTLQATAEGGSARSEKNTSINIKTEVKKRVWPKVLGGLVLMVVAGVGSSAYYQWDQQRVKPATGLHDIKLSMRQEEVTARFGRQPDCPVTKTENEMTMPFKSFIPSSIPIESTRDCDFKVTLEKNYDNIYRTARVCQWDGYIPNLGWDESSVLKKLGKPDSESFSVDGTLKVSNFKKYNLSLSFSGGKAYEICVMRDPSLVFANAFKPG